MMQHTGLALLLAHRLRLDVERDVERRRRQGVGRRSR
jgi:hypothetical protein